MHASVALFCARTAHYALHDDLCPLRILTFERVVGGKVNIDAQLVKKSGARLSQVEEKLVEMQNGCICCTLREDLLLEISKLCSEGKFDYLLIESSGISEPMPVAETFTFDVPLPGEVQKTLGDLARLDTMVTVIDAFSFNKDLRSIESLAERYGEDQVPEQDGRSVANLLIDQVRRRGNRGRSI